MVTRLGTEVVASDRSPRRGSPVPPRARRAVALVLAQGGEREDEPDQPGDDHDHVPSREATPQPRTATTTPTVDPGPVRALVDADGSGHAGVPGLSGRATGESGMSGYRTTRAVCTFRTDRSTRTADRRQDAKNRL